MPRYVDDFDPNDPKARRLRPRALTPEWAMERFLDRACDHAIPQAGLFAVAALIEALAVILNRVVRLAELDAEAAQEAVAAKRGVAPR